MPEVEKEFSTSPENLEQIWFDFVLAEATAQLASSPESPPSAQLPRCLLVETELRISARLLQRAHAASTPIRQRKRN